MFFFMGARPPYPPSTYEFAEFAEFTENIPLISRNLRTTKFKGKNDSAELAEFSENIPVISKIPQIVLN